MNLLPSFKKYKKEQKRCSFYKIKPILHKEYLRFGVLMLIAKEASRIKASEFEAVRNTILKVVKKSGKVVLKIFPHTPITKKPIEVRMGKGKGPVNLWGIKVSPGSVLFEINTSSKLLGLKALRIAQKKLSIKTRIVLST